MLPLVLAMTLLPVSSWRPIVGILFSDVLILIFISANIMKVFFNFYFDTRVTFALFLIIVGLLLSSLFDSAGLIPALPNIGKIIFVFAYISLFLNKAIFSAKSFEVVTLGLVFSGIVNGIGVVSQAAGFFASDLYFGAESYGRFPGFCEHPNETGMIASASIIAGFYFLAFKRCEARILGWIFLSVLGSLVSLVLCASMTAMSSTFIGLLLLCFFQTFNGERRGFFIFFSFLVACLFIMPLFFVFGGENSIQERVIRQINQENSDDTLASRVDTYFAAFDSIYSNPLVGVGASPDNSHTVTGYAVHNLFISYFYIGGFFSFLGLAMVLIFVLSVLLATVKNKNFAKHDYDCWAASCCASGIFVAVLMGGQFAPILFQRSFWLPISISIGWAVFLSVRAGLQRVTSPVSMNPGPQARP